MERFLRYSLAHGRKIRVMLLWEGALAQRTVTVLALEPECVTLREGTRKPPFTVAWGDILSCAYARGDHGEE